MSNVERGNHDKRRQTQDLRFEQLENRLLLAGDFDFRSIDGLGNHLLDWGAAETQLIRSGEAEYPADGSGETMMTPPTRENPRVISNAVADQGQQLLPNARQMSDFVWQWGQFLDHDIDLSEASAANGTVDIPVPTGDPDFDPAYAGNVVIPFERTDFDPATGTSGVARQQINSITAFIDASNVYGSDETTAASLRTYVDGKMKTTAGGKLLPVVDGSFVGGDVRANEQVGLTSMHTLFVREHNRLADRLGQVPGIEGYAATEGLSTDEFIYQTARKIVGAELQMITYQEFLPALLGEYAPNAGDYSYHSSVNPSIMNEFSTALYRFGHSMLSPNLLVVDGNYEASELPLRDAFFTPEYLGGSDLYSPVDTGNVDRLLRGLAFQQAQQIDCLLVDDVRNALFGPPGSGGTDLASLNIQRGRDHGLPDYNSVRAAYGLTPKTTFLDNGSGNGITSDPWLAGQLEDMYGSVNNVDVWVGGLAEDHVPGASVGSLVGAAIHDQFSRLRDGDRYFYAGDSDMSHPVITQVIDLHALTLAEVIRKNTSVTEIQDNVFEASGAVVQDGVLYLHGSSGSDHVEVLRLSSDRLLVTANFLPGGAREFDATQIDRIKILVFDGHDTVQVSHDVPVWIDGGRGDDDLYGGLSHDYIIGGPGRNRLFGGSGGDWLFGGDSGDRLYGGSGNDWLVGGKGNDLLDGGSGSDLLEGGEGSDLLLGRSGNDYLYGNEDQDYLVGGEGADKVFAMDGFVDFIFGDNDDDNDADIFDIFQ